MTEAIAATVVLIVFLPVFGVGFAVARAGNPPTVSLPTPAATADASCRAAATTWDAARQMQCSARADEASARSRADAIRGQMLAFIAAAVALGTGAAATLVAAGLAKATIAGIPLGAILLGIAIGLAIAATAALIYSEFLAGQLVAAETDFSAKAGTRAAWDTEVARARAEVNKHCTLAEANAVLSRTAPC